GAVTGPVATATTSAAAASGARIIRYPSPAAESDPKPRQAPSQNLPRQDDECGNRPRCGLEVTFRWRSRPPHATARGTFEPCARYPALRVVQGTGGPPHDEFPPPPPRPRADA